MRGVKSIEGCLYRNGYRVKWENGIRKLAHIFVAEKALGRPLPIGSEVHHVNGDKQDNRNTNLVICPNQKYHRLLHKRTKALDAGYPANFRTCSYCKKFDAPENLYISPSDSYAKHRKCSAEEAVRRKARRKTK